MNPASISLFVAGGRVLLLAAALALAVSGLLLAIRGSPPAQTTHSYVCPMHPEVSAEEAGRCPICQMALQRKSSAPRAPSRSLTPSSPPHTIVHKLDAQTASARLAAGVTWLPETTPPLLPTRPDDAPAIGTAERRTFVEATVAAAWLETADRLLAVVYLDELVGLSPGDVGAFRAARRPRTVVSVQRTDDPPTPWDDSTVLVRFRVTPARVARYGGSETPPAALLPGEAGWLELPDRSRDLLVIPESALLRSERGPYVLIEAPTGGHVEARQLQIGRTRKGQVSVLAGLDAGQRLLTGGAFFFDAERRAESSAGLLAEAGR